MTKLKQSLSKIIEQGCENTFKPDAVVRLPLYSESKQSKRTVKFTYLSEFQTATLLKILCSAICFF